MIKRALNLCMSLLEQDIETAILCKKPNILYFSGATPVVFSLLLIDCLDKEIFLIVPELEYEDCIEKSFKGVNVLCNPKDVKLTEFFMKEFHERIFSRKIGIEDSFPISTYNKLTDKMKCQVKTIDDIIYSIRSVKSSNELSLIKKACHITEKALCDTINEISVGMTELEIKGLLNYNIYKRGGEGTAFDTIVAIDSNSSKPHAKSGGIKLRKSSVMIIDCGAVYRGYCSDMTRTILMDDAPKKAHETVKICLKAHIEAATSLAEGAKACEVNEIATKILAKYKLDKYFIHGLGHGVGVEIHEKPYLNALSKDILKTGNTVTIEPGVYFKGKFGVRIEDMYVIKGDHAERMHTLDQLI